MAVFYRGAGIGTYWHEKDPRLSGFTPHSPGIEPSDDRLMNHITNLTVTSPYVSLTRSYGIALGYAQLGTGKPTRANPAYVWEIELSDPLPESLKLVDPVQEIAVSLPSPEQRLTYHHDGEGHVLLGLVDPRVEELLLEPVPAPPGTLGTPKAPNLSLELRTLIRALRDAEILAIGTIPASRVRARHEVY